MLAANFCFECLTSGVEVVVPTSPGLFASAHFLDGVLETNANGTPGLAFGQSPPGYSAPEDGKVVEDQNNGKLWVMDARGVDDGVELMTGLVAAGCHAVVVFTDRPVFPSHPFAPVAVVSSKAASGYDANVRQALALAIESHVNGEKNSGTAFQITRGITGISV